MAKTHVALIRGINVGKAKRVAMADLRRIVSELGYTDVHTLLNSGNVVFSAASPAEHAQRIELSLTRELGVSARVLVLSAEELAHAVADNPLLNRVDDPSRLLVAALSPAHDRQALLRLAKEQWEPEAFALGKRVAYLWCAQGILQSRLLTAISKVLGEGTTTRDWTTILKLHAIASERP